MGCRAPAKTKFDRSGPRHGPEGPVAGVYPERGGGQRVRLCPPAVSRDGRGAGVACESAGGGRGPGVGVRVRVGVGPDRVGVRVGVGEEPGVGVRVEGVPIDTLTARVLAVLESAEIVTPETGSVQDWPTTRAGSVNSGVAGVMSRRQEEQGYS